MLTPLIFMISLVLLLRRFKANVHERSLDSYMLPLQSGLFIRSLLMELYPPAWSKVFN